MIKLLKKIYDYLDDFYWWNHHYWLKYIIEDKHRRLRLSPNWFRAVWFRIRNGWDSSDTWSLQFTISKFVLPRLKRFKEVSKGSVPNKIYQKVNGDMKLASKEWNEKLDKMVLAFQRIIDEDEDFHDFKDKKYWDKQEKIKEDGLKLFAEYFQDLWW